MHEWRWVSGLLIRLVTATCMQVSIKRKPIAAENDFYQGYSDMLEPPNMLQENKAIFRKVLIALLARVSCLDPRSQYRLTVCIRAIHVKPEGVLSVKQMHCLGVGAGALARLELVRQQEEGVGQRWQRVQAA